MNCYHILFAGYKFGLWNEFAVETLVKLTRGFNLATLIFMNLNSLTGTRHISLQPHLKELELHKYCNFLKLEEASTFQHKHATTHYIARGDPQKISGNQYVLCMFPS